MAKQPREFDALQSPPRVDGELLSSAQRVSQSLKEVTKELRSPTGVWSSLLTDSRGRPLDSFRLTVLFSFFTFVMIPIFAVGVYLAVFTSNQYASEVRFAVRGGEFKPSADPLSALTGASTVRIQDSQIVANYIRGQGMVEALERSLKLRHLFSWPEKADFVFGFNTSKSIERLVAYWWWQVDVDIDRFSGIITVVVRAFTPQDALTIAREIITSSENLVNELSERSRKDSLKQAQSELVLAERNLQSTIQEMRQLRTTEKLLDPGKTSEALTKMLSELRLELAKMGSDYDAQKRSVLESSPQMRVLKARIDAGKAQIRQIEEKMAGDRAVNSTLAESISRFDRLRVEQDLAQKQYIEAAAALERARTEVDTQQVYLTTFLQPVLAEDALYPKRWWIFIAFASICLALWGAVIGVAFMVRYYSG